jgi:hypothetical protein
MNCDCVTKTEEKFADHFRKDAGDSVSARCMATAFSISADLGNVAFAVVIPFSVKGDKKGFTAAKGKIVNFTASFCPFCGVSTRKKEEVAA